MISIPEELSEVLVSDPETLSGAIRFKNTRVHVSLLINNLLAGLSLEEFLENYPGIKKEDAQKVLDWYAKNRVQSDFNPPTSEIAS